MIERLINRDVSITGEEVDEEIERLRLVTEESIRVVREVQSMVVRSTVVTVQMKADAIALLVLAYRNANDLQILRDLKEMYN